MKERLARLRGIPLVARATRTWEHHTQVNGSLLAGSMTYFGFLSFFPLLALAFAVVGYVVVAYPDARQELVDLLTEYLPGGVVGSGEGQLDVDQLASARTAAGIIGVLGLLYAGLGWVGALRDSLRVVFGVPRDERNIVKRKLADAGALLILGLAILVSAAASTLVSGAAGWVLNQLGIDSALLAFALSAVGLALAIALDMVVLAVMFVRLSGAEVPRRALLGGALVGALGFELLKTVGAWLIAQTTGNPVFGAFAVTAGLLVWIYYLHRVLVLAACWAAVPVVNQEPPRAVPEPEPVGATG